MQMATRGGAATVCSSGRSCVPSFFSARGVGGQVCLPKNHGGRRRGTARPVVLPGVVSPGSACILGERVLRGHQGLSGKLPRVRGRTPGLPPAGRPSPPLGGCGCRARTALRSRRRGSTRGVASRLAVGPPAPAHRRDEPDASPRRRSCRPSFAVAFEHRLAHRAQGKACVPLQPVQMPFEARDRRQVHRGPRVPVQSRREDRQPARRSLRRLDRGVAADP